MTRQYWANLALCIVLGALVLFSVTRIGSALTPKGLFVREPEPSADAAQIMQDVILADYQIVNDLDDHVVEAEFIIQNHSDRDIKNISVLCDFEDGNKNHRDRKIWNLVQSVPAQHQVNIKSVSQNYINTTATLSACAITDFQLVREPFFTLERHAGGEHESAAEAGHDDKPASGH